jgi:hypothetical protein
MIHRFSLKCLLLLTAFSIPTLAQETIFNVPSGDILDKGKVHGEFDFAYLWNASAGAYTPHHSAGYFTPGAAIKLSSKATAYLAYEIGNSGAFHGNDLLLWNWVGISTDP